MSQDSITPCKDIQV
uniref:Uncharacterized protein n=1 Tax=Moniliophthora roreri TaxID=221103 RepID=A0A0W0GAC4_MONRR